jgi:hypothetical protein
MISWLDFCDYPLDKKVRTLYEHGTFIMAIRYYGYKVNLYLLENRYIEVFVNHKLGAIEKIALLDSAHSRMKFYTDQIRLPEQLIAY